MTYQQAEALLSDFPKLFEAVVNQRNNIIYGGYRVMTGSRRGCGGHSDATANRAIKLIELGGAVRLLALIRKWLASKLKPEDRQILIEIWRHSTWWAIARRCKQGVLVCQSRWQRMVLSLKVFVGHATRRVGVACVAGLPTNQKAL